MNKRQARSIAVVGVSYVGLPIAVAFGKIGPVIGFDINKKKIEELQKGIDRTGRSVKRGSWSCSGPIYFGASRSEIRELHYCRSAHTDQRCVTARSDSVTKSLRADWAKPVFGCHRPPAVGQHHGPGFPFYHAPSVDLSMKFFADTEEEWVLVSMISHGAGDCYASADVTLWDAKRRLLAHGTQLMLIRFPDPKDLAIVP